jgi:amino acid adenylation domain-containing protein/thioester reductase-like protein
MAVKKNLLDEFNHTYKPENYLYSIVERFEDIVRQYPQNLAVCFENETQTYLELNQIANGYAKLLLEMGIQKTSRVIIYLDESLEMISMIIAVLKTGASYIPLPQSFPLERIFGIARDAECFAIISNTRCISDSAEIHCPAILVDQLQVKPLASNLGIYHQAQDCVYNIFTSGSTGKPKGVSISQANLINFTDYCINSCHLTYQDHGAKFAGYGFDASIIEIFPILLAGGTLHILSKEIKLDPQKLNAYFELNNISYAFLPTQFCEIFVTSVENHSLKNLMVGGDKLRRVKLGNYNLINVYGPTETTVVATVFYVDREDYQNIPIGKAITNYTTYIVNEQMERVAIGEIGELCIGGDGVGIGYINLPEQTAARFIKNPFVTEEEIKQGRNGNIYKTGDLACYLPDGNIEFLGRNDFQVKIRGFRIELGEIEHGLLKLPGIKDCLVIAVNDAHGNSYLCAYYVADAQIDTAGINAVLAQTMPDYMIPSVYVHMTSFPINANGKVDRKVLPQPDLSQLGSDYQAPSNEEERIICQAFSNVLDLEQVGACDDFYQLGGNSIKAIMLVSQLQQDFQITIGDIFTLKTPAGLATLPRETVKKTISKQNQRKEYPLSLAQERIYIANQLSFGTTLYNVPQRIIIKGNLDKELLGIALDNLVKRHSCLRSNFIERDGKLFQIIHPEFDFRKGISKASVKELDQLFSDFIRPFNLSRDLLIRAMLISIDSSHHQLFLDMPHIVFDGGSLQPLLRDLAFLYGNTKLPILSIEYSDFAIWQREGDGVKWIEREEQYWFKRFSHYEVEPLSLPYDYSRPHIPDYRGDSFTLTIDSQLFAAINELAINHNVSIYSVCLLVVNILFHIYSGQRNLVIGTATSGRTHLEVNEMLGMFVNTLPLLTEINPEGSVIELLQTLQKNVLALIENQDYPFEKLMQHLKLSSQNGCNPLFNVVFNYLEDYQTVINYGDLLWQYTPWQENTVAKFDLTLTANKKNHELSLEFNYAVSLFSRATIQRMAEHLLNLFKQLAFATVLNEPIKKLEILSPDERHQLLVDFNGCNVAYPRNKTVIDLFEDTVTTFPEYTAVVAKNGSLTYRELNKRAEQIAGYLMRHGVKPDDLVGILIDNRLEMIIMVIGVIKSGAAYVPMAYDTPLERVSYILEDSQAKFLLTLPELVAGISTNAAIVDISNQAISDIYHRPQVNCNNLIYAIYTSGTTGKPKGTLLEHRGVVNYASFVIQDNKLTEKSIGSKFAGFGFDASVCEIYPILLCGAKLCLIPDEDKIDPVKVNNFFTEHQVNYAFLPTQFAELFFELDNHTINNMIVGGDKLRKFTAKPYTVKNGYGPTETTVESNQFTVDRMYDNIPIGKPLSNYSCYVVNKNMQLLPIGAVGELLIGGDGVARGYLNQGELTAQKFIANPFQSDEEKHRDYNARIYKTGDLVRWLSDGNLEYIGRNDFQVKIRGYRIELGEIENRLQALSGVEQVLVIALEDNSQNKYLCAYYTGREYKPEEIHDLLSLNVAAYMIPEHFIWLEKFPINVNGKIDRRALPEPDLSQLSSNYQAPSSKEESIICDEFGYILGLDQVGVNADFYRLGGNSIKTICLVSKLQTNFKVNVSDIFKYKTPAELAKHIPYVKDNLKQKLEQIKNHYTTSSTRSSLTVDLKAEHHKYLQQVETITYDYSSKNVEQVILTGATGYLGCNLLYQLLKTTNYRIVALVRAKNDVDAQHRVAAKTNYYFDEDLTTYSDRLVVHAADLEAPLLQLEETLYQNLLRNTDMVIHCAALVKHYGEYEIFYRANVHATKNLLEFCKSSRGKDFHYISTYSVLQDGYVPQSSVFFANEDVIGSEFTARNNVYVQTKYEGEIVTREYRNFGVTSNIYRVGNLSMISFNSRNQENIDDNGFYTRVKAMLNLGMTASEIATIEISPVDVTAAGIIKLASQKELANQTFHVYNPKKTDLSVVFSRDPLLRIRKLTINEFIDNLLAKINFDTYRNYIEMFMLHEGWLQETTDLPHTQIVMVQDRTQAILSYLGVDWPQIDIQSISDLLNQAFKSRTTFLTDYLCKHDLPKSVVLDLAKLSSLVNYEPGQLLIDQNQQDKRIKFIMAGVVDSYIKSIGGWVGTLQLMGEGDVINFEALNDVSSRASYQAIFDNVATIELNKSDLCHLASKYPRLYQIIIAKVLADKDLLQQMYACLN